MTSLPRQSIILTQHPTLKCVDEKNSQAVKRLLESLVKQLGIYVIVSNDLSSCKQAADMPGVDHQICQFHVHRWAGTELRELQQNSAAEWLWMVAQVRHFLANSYGEG